MIYDTYENYPSEKNRALEIIASQIFKYLINKRIKQNHLCKTFFVNTTKIQ